MESKLMPCKRCGSANVGYWYSFSVDGKPIYRPTCNNCGNEGKSYRSQEVAIKNWNRRRSADDHK